MPIQIELVAGAPCRGSHAAHVARIIEDSARAPQADLVGRIQRVAQLGADLAQGWPLAQKAVMIVEHPVLDDSRRPPRAGGRLAEEAVRDESLDLGGALAGGPVIGAGPVVSAGASADLESDAGRVAERPQFRPQVAADVDSVVLPATVGHAAPRAVTDE